MSELGPNPEGCLPFLLAPPLQKYQNEFNTNVAMAEIYKYAKRYRPQVSSPTQDWLKVRPIKMNFPL